MAVKAQSVRRLLIDLSEKIHVEMDYAGFGTMSDYIDSDSISQKYLDDTYRLVRKKILADQMNIGSHEKKLNVIAKKLGYKSFQDFENNLIRPLDPILLNSVGHWWSLVRSNTGDNIYKAPVWIRNDPHEGVYITLKGQENLFMGKVMASAGCIFCELNSEKEKKLYIVLKGSINTNCQMLQGIFTGISSTGDPIGGRELFMRETGLAFKDMKWSKLSVNENALDAKVKTYFEHAEGNVIKINNQIDLG